MPVVYDKDMHICGCSLQAHTLWHLMNFFPWPMGVHILEAPLYFCVLLTKINTYTVAALNRETGKSASMCVCGWPPVLCKHTHIMVPNSNFFFWPMVSIFQRLHALGGFLDALWTLLTIPCFNFMNTWPIRLLVTLIMSLVTKSLHSAIIRVYDWEKSGLQSEILESWEFLDTCVAVYYISRSSWLWCCLFSLLWGS